MMYAVGDNELNDCHRDFSTGRAADFYKASDARAYLISEFGLSRATDLTGAFPVTHHTGPGLSCDFDKYLEMEDYAVVTLEVMGSQWYLRDETGGKYTKQNIIDPLAGRFAMYTNAKDCALSFIEW